MRISLSELLATHKIVLADGATATNYFQIGLSSGEPPEFWLDSHPERVTELHQQFVDAGADIILTNTFGANRHRLKLHNAQHRTYELAKRAAELAREVVDASARPVVVAGSVGPTGELFEPLGALTHDEAVDTFEEQIRGLLDGGADVAWIETMSAIEEVQAAAQAAINVGMPYVATCSFDTAGRTMMGLKPDGLAAVFAGLEIQPIAMGANCGVGASDILVTILEMVGAPVPLVSKGNCGIPRFEGIEIRYSGTPELMSLYAGMAIDSGARIVGGCCGTSPEHLAAMRYAIDHHAAGTRPTIEQIIEVIGPLTNKPPTDIDPNRRTSRRGVRN
ncbi:MAG: betaine--homocysteine S-methyltransferase [Acidimicrobiaceae bacterium]|nr:betaine--homocysteine S-methyltransferase [Acidimicrobiaceae bacterium]